MRWVGLWAPVVVLLAPCPRQRPRQSTVVTDAIDPCPCAMSTFIMSSRQSWYI